MLFGKPALSKFEFQSISTIFIYTEKNTKTSQLALEQIDLTADMVLDDNIQIKLLFNRFKQ